MGAKGVPLVHWWSATSLLLVLVAAATWDMREGRVPNALSYSAIGLGLLLSIVPGGPRFLNSAGGLLAGGGGFLFLWLFRLVGGGDVKLMAAVGSFVGWPGILSVIFFTALAGGVLGILYLIWGAAPRSKGAGVRERGAAGRKLKQRIPYAPAIAAGTLIALLLG